MRNLTPTEEATTTRPTTSPSTTPASSPRVVPGRRVLVVVGATVAALLLWLVADVLLGVDLSVLAKPGSSETASVSAGAIIASTMAAGLAGWTLLTVLERRSHRGITIWRWIASTVTLLSLVAPSILAQSSAGAVTLVLLHLLVAGVLIVGLPSAGREKAARDEAGR